MDNRKVKLYLAIGGATLALILVVIAMVTHLSGGDATQVGGAAVAAATVAGSAAVSRAKARAEVESAQTTASDIAKQVADNKAEADAAMSAVPGEVAAKPRDEKEREGENLFGPGGRG